MNDQKPKLSSENNKNLGQIIKYLKDKPFLLIIIAVLLLVTIILSFDLEKIREFKWLIMGVVFLPLIMQFYLELRKVSASRAEGRNELPDRKSVV